MSTSKQIASMALEIDKLIRPILTLDGTIAEYAPLTLDHRRGIAYRVAHLAKDYLLLQKQNKQTEAERDWLINKIVDMGEGHEHAVCPALGTPCAPASYDCTICWSKAASEVQHEEGVA
jgi:hypothetical protein